VFILPIINETFIIGNMNTMNSRLYNHIKSGNLADWLVSHGKTVITAEEVADILGIPRQEVAQRLLRARNKGQFATLSKGIWAVVPPEYREFGAPEPQRYIDVMMEKLECEYCVGWLSAAAIHGARHQAPQVFQVALDRSLRERKVGRTKLIFYKRAYVSEISKRRVNLSSGAIMVATPGATMLMAAADLILCGGIDNVATIITELADENPSFLQDIMSNVSLFPHTAVCRLGWILENISGQKGLDELSDYCQSKKTIAELSPYDGRSGTINKRWNIIENRAVEADI